MALWLTGCGLSNSNSDRVDDLVLQDVENRLGTQAAATVMAEKALNAGMGGMPPAASATFTPPAAPTATSEELTGISVQPAPTETPLAPTPTLPPPTATLPPTDTPVPPAPTDPPTAGLPPADMHCEVIGQNPENGFVATKGADFDLTWTLQNTGADAWSPAFVWAGFISGDKLHKYDNTKLIAHDVAPGETLDLALDIRLPSETGTFSDTWGLFYGDQAFCEFSLTVEINQ